MKRVVSFGLCILMLTVMAIPAMAAETTCFSMSASSDILHRGDTVTFTVAVSGGAPATSYGFLLSYDSAVFQLVDGSCTVSGTLISSFHNGFAFMFQNPTAYSGTVGTVTFRVKEDAAFGSITVSGTASVKNGSATVSASGASKTVEISCAHSYSGWSEANDTFHKRKCAMCGKEETAYHSWDNGNITRQPTSEEEGIMTYTCSICNAVKTEYIPKLNDQKCGDNLMWTLDDQGTLTIFGSGEMWGWVYPEFAPWYDQRSSIQKIVVEPGATSIGLWAFYDCNRATSVTLPSSLTVISERAFFLCESLTDVVIPEGVTTIGEYAFNWCTAMTSVTIPEGVTYIGESAFARCTSLTSVTIPGSVNELGASAFEYCENLTDVNILSATSGIGQEAFYYCTKLTNVTIGDKVTSIGKYAFAQCFELSTVTFGNGLIAIDEYAFFDCKSLTTITIPNNVTAIGGYAFFGCERLSEVLIGAGVTSIGGSAFSYCSGLKELTFKGHAPAIDMYIFYNVTATVYYPANDDSWTEAVRQKCGGIITWIPVASCSAGDANNDGTVNPLDALMLLQCYIGMVDVEALTFAACDCNGDGTINPLDALVVLQYYVGMIEKFPVA